MAAPPPTRGRKKSKTLVIAPPVSAIRPRKDEAAESAQAQRQQAALNDDLLEQIFLRIGSPIDLARTSTACISFRRIITDLTFLRHYRALHPPLFLGLVHNSGFLAAQEPHPNGPAASALAHAAGAGFCFNEYLSHSDRAWHLCDVRNGRVLLNCRPTGCSHVLICPDIAVCDPLHRKHQLMPAISKELLAAVQVQERKTGCFLTFFAPSRYEEDETFRVIGIADCLTKTVVFVFSSGSGCWNIGTTATWGDLSFSSPQPLRRFYTPDRAYGCFYWCFTQSNKSLKLDIDRMEFSTIDLPHDRGSYTAILWRQGKVGLGRFVTRFVTNI